MERLRRPEDEVAWRRFVELYVPLVERLARRQGLSVEACESLVQDFLFRAVQTLPRFEYRPERGRFRNWVLTVARNELRQAQRAHAARERALDGYRRTLEASASDEDFEGWWRDAEEKRALELALERLQEQVPPEKYAIFRLVALNGRPVGEVASFYGIRNGQISLVKFRLLKRLRAIAEEILGDWDGV